MPIHHRVCVLLAFVAFLPQLLAGQTAPATQPRGPIEVYLIGGQSNATGQGYMKNLPEEMKPNPKVMLYHSGRPSLNSGAEANTWVPLRQASESPDRFGPEISFGNRLQELRPGSAIALIKHAHSGTNLFRDWRPGAKAGPAGWGGHFRTFVQTVDSGMAKLREQGYEPVIRGMIWQQGESDASRNPATSEAYGQNLAAFIGRVREQFDSPGMLFVYGYVLPPPNNPPGREAIRRGQREVDQNSGSALAVKGAFVVETDDLGQRADDPGTPLPNDRLHFSSAGNIELGKRMAEAMARQLIGSAAAPPAATTPSGAADRH